MAASAHLRLPPAARPRTVLLAALLALALLAGWELVLGASPLGAAPFETPAPPLRERILAHEGDPAPRVALLGSSRTFCGISPDDFASACGSATPVDMLSAPGTNSFRLLRVMAGRGELHGVVVVEVMPDIFYRDHPAPLAAKVQAELDSADCYITTDVAIRGWCGKLRVFSSGGSPLGRSRRAIRQLLRIEDVEEETGHVRAHVSHANGWTEIIPNPGYLMHAQMEIVQMAAGARAHQKLIVPCKWEALLAELIEIDRTLAQRGCVVVFVRFPSSGVLYEAEQEVFPDHLYWDRLVEAFPGRAWHFRDNPEFRDMDLPDGSHMVSEDARRFSRWLGARVAPLLAGLPKQDTD